MTLDSLGPDVVDKEIDPLHEGARRLTERLTNGQQQAVPKAASGAAAECDQQWVRARVHRVLGELQKQVPDHTYRILRMPWIDGCTMLEIAASLNLSIEQVWAGHHRAKEKFRFLFELNQHFP